MWYVADKRSYCCVGGGWLSGRRAFTDWFAVVQHGRWFGTRRVRVSGFKERRACYILCFLVFCLSSLVRLPQHKVVVSPCVPRRGVQVLLIGAGVCVCLCLCFVIPSVLDASLRILARVLIYGILHKSHSRRQSIPLNAFSCTRTHTLCSHPF